MSTVTGDGPEPKLPSAAGLRAADVYWERLAVNCQKCGQPYYALVRLSGAAPKDDAPYADDKRRLAVRVTVCCRNFDCKNYSP